MSFRHTSTRIQPEPDRIHRNAMAQAAKLPVLPTECPKCKAERTWLRYALYAAECSRCGWTGYLRVPTPDDEPVSFTSEETSQAKRRAAWARLRAMTPEELDRHMAQMRSKRHPAAS